MGYEPVIYKDKSVESSNAIIARLQKFMELHLLKGNHPGWFHEVIEDIHSNFHISVGKFFFDEEVLADKDDRITYSLGILDQVIHEMEKLTFREFRETIKKEVMGTYCSFESPFDTNSEAVFAYSYQVYYIGCLENIKRMMIGCHPHLSGYDH